MKHILKYTLTLLAVLLTAAALMVCASADDEYMVPFDEGTPPAPVSGPNPTEDDLNDPGGGFLRYQSGTFTLRNHLEEQNGTNKS